MEGIGSLPSVMDGKAFGHVEISKAHASFGFEKCLRNDPEDQSIQYSIFLNMYISKRLLQFKRPLRVYISGQYQ